MLGSGGEHSGLVDGNIFICRKVLTLLFFAAVENQRQAWIDGFIGPYGVGVDVGLADIVVLI